MGLYGKGIVEVMSDETYKKFNVDFISLKETSHQKIVVKCTRCGEIFTRERRNLHQLHACVTHKTRHDGVKLKWCNKCQKFLTYECFNNNRARYDGLSSLCKSCMPRQKWPTDRKKSKPKKKNLKDWMDIFIKNKINRCKNSGIAFELDLDYCLDMWNNQNGLCFYTDIPMTFGKKLFSASLDRIDSSLGYVDGNVVWCCIGINYCKNNSPIDEFKTSHTLMRKAAYAIRSEIKFLHEDAQEPRRTRATDAGYDISSIEDAIIEPHGTANIQTGIALAVPPGFYYTVDGRSSMAMNGVIPFRGIIDSGYSGPLMVALMNFSDIPYEIHKGDRIAQVILHKQYDMDMTVIEDFSPEYSSRGDDGQAGFGSTGR